MKVSICLPTLNSIRYLPDRLSSIVGQSYENWELIVVDSGSSDGTIQMVEDLRAQDERVQIIQTPPDGIYPNFNRGIEFANAELVYIATSDDTMADNFLEKMVSALESNQDCDIAHCPMRVLSADGSLGIDWWREESIFARSTGSLLIENHKRLAPLDGVLCLLGNNVYSSVTQMLIRKCLFDRVGGYKSTWGSLGDFHWNLRAGLVANTIHVPDTWGGWRMHPEQATAGVRLGSRDHQISIDQMIADVLDGLDRFVEKSEQVEICGRLVPRARVLRDYLREYEGCRSVFHRRLFMLRQLVDGKLVAWTHLCALLGGGSHWVRDAPELVVSWFDDDVLVPLG
jgi:glycosyltransferase involved in cell wall biosynthesis